MTLTLAIETSCDDTCAAVLDGERVLSNAIASQGVHDAYGGVVPELAARQHVEAIGPVIGDALRTAGVEADAIEQVAVTRGPGLVGSLLCGVQTAKAFAAPSCLPVIPVDHMHGHLLSGRLAEVPPPAAPHLVLVASGGHTLLARVDGADPRADEIEILGRTLDDAAGEAIDKGARLLGLGYPGGPALARLAEQGDPEAYDLPTSARVAGLDFSFSGLKTALLYIVRDLAEAELEARRADLAASYQRAVVDTLILRIERALAQHDELDHVAIGGGVAANALLRRRLADLGCGLSIPAREYCTDNAAMIGVAAVASAPVAYPDFLALDAYGTGQGPIR
ncbi:MAG: tRNA (adenosine(37)-N6)-threonylcarbamoyltransferase complex transferase subunit TsaD [Solirubrobacteraceae bacterium]|nr:tRNA (adenosine(37)-N6)-threonylcarbamoyltransferase complex transferase subunit TsaD [Solirubrobacteraceae bacterium]